MTRSVPTGHAHADIAGQEPKPFHKGPDLQGHVF